MEQFFIKITPNQNLVNCGKLNIKKSKTELAYYFDSNNNDSLTYSSAIDWLNNSVRNHSVSDTKVVFFIHGFWGSLPYAINRTAQEFHKSYFQSDSSKVEAIVHIIWDASNLKYETCLGNIQNSTSSLATLLNLVDSNLMFRKSLLCHSMGNRFFLQTLKNEALKISFEELLLLAPDIDYTDFEKHHKLFSNLSDKVVVFYHTKDQTLKMSRGINKIERLGRKSVQINNPSIEFIDFTSIKDIKTASDKMMKHLYFITSKTTRLEINRLIRQ